jgi:hypothetical protein
VNAVLTRRARLRRRRASAVVKLVIAEPESAMQRRHLRRRPLLSSILARTDVLRALLPAGAIAVPGGHEVLRALDMARVNDRVLDATVLAFQVVAQVTRR